MNVHPSIGENPPGPTTADPFAPEALYELMIDTDGDAVADIAYRVRFSSSKSGAQTATLRHVEGAQAAGSGDSGQVIVEDAPVSTGREAQVTEAGEYRFFAGWRSDPFFFDRRGALKKTPREITGLTADVINPFRRRSLRVVGSKPRHQWRQTPHLQPLKIKGQAGKRHDARACALPARS
jgi:hypothetical protein